MLCSSGFELYSRWVPLKTEFRAKLNILQFAIETMVEDASVSGDIPPSWHKCKLFPVQCQELFLEIQWF